MENGAIRVETVHVGILLTSCYIVSREGSAACVVVDPGDQADRILAVVGDRHIEAVLLTHGHFDHIGAVDAVMQPDTVLYVHEAEQGMLKDPVLNVSRKIRRDMTVAAEPVPLREGSEFEAAGIRFTVLHTPGHTPGSCCYQAENVLLTGDTLFYEGCGRTDLPGGSDADMYRSLVRLQSITPGKTIYPGHG